MTNQEKVKYLSRYKRLDKEIERLYGEITFWREKADLASPRYSDIPKTKTTANRIEDAVEHVQELEAAMKTQIQELMRVRRRIDRGIRTVEDEVLQLLLKYRYIDALDWESVAEELGYSTRHTLRLHNTALTKLNMS